MRATRTRFGDVAGIGANEGGMNLIIEQEIEIGNPDTVGELIAMLAKLDRNLPLEGAYGIELKVVRQKRRPRCESQALDCVHPDVVRIERR